MNIFRRDKSSTAPPVVPPRPNKEELEHPITHSHTPKEAEITSYTEKSIEITSDPATKVRKKSDLDPEVQLSLDGYLINVLVVQRNAVMGVMQKVNPFKSSTQVKLESKTASVHVQ